MIKYLLFIPQTAPFIILLYLLPGFALSRFYSGRWRNQPLFWIFLSLIFNGPLYSVLALTNKVSLSWWVMSEALVFLLLFIAGRRFRLKPISLIEEKEVAPQGLRKYILPFILTAFFIIISLTKYDIFIKRMPIVADDYWQIPKIVSVATSTNVSQHFQYPLTNLSYYYYSYVSPGLLTRFSNNVSQAQRSFTIDFVLRLGASLYLIWMAARLLFKKYLGQLSFILATTFLGGWEFWVGFLSGQKDLFTRHLEYWPGAAWLSSMPQISGFTTTFIWAPHHLFAALTMLPVFLLIFRSVGSGVIRCLLLSLLLSGAVGFSFFAGLAVFFTYFSFSVLSLVFKKNKQSIRELLLTLLLIGILLAPFMMIIGTRRSEISWSLPSPQILNGLGQLPAPLNFLITLPIYYFLDMGVLFLGLLYVLLVIFRRSARTTEALFWLVALLPMLGVLFIKFPTDNEFVAQSRTTVPALIALVVFTGYALEKINKKLGYALLVFYSLTTLTAISEINQNLKPTPRTYNFYSQLDELLPLNSIIFADIHAANNYYWLVPLFVHRMIVKQNEAFDQVDRQYTGFDPYPADGLVGDDLSSVRLFLEQHPALNRQYHLYYLTKTPQSLPLQAQDLDYRLYGLN